jgi:hypothetical protein
MSTKIRPAHLARPALVYIRQSTLLQVHEHRESTERQYALVELAKTLGWDATQVEVIDEDLGQSGASSARRKGFQRLTAEVSLGKVGAVLSLEVSRLARSSSDWHRLLDLWGLRYVEWAGARTRGRAHGAEPSEGHGTGVLARVRAMNEKGARPAVPEGRGCA